MHSSNISIELKRLIHEYLENKINHETIKEYAWTIIDKENELVGDNILKVISVAFTIIHVADDEHWNDGVSKRSLKSCLLDLQPV